MRFASLGSGSRGNATLIEGGGTRLLLDCGYPAREVVRRLALLDVMPESLDGILVTHEHQDHIRGVGPLARRYGIPVWITHGTHQQNRCGDLPELRLIHSHQSPFEIGALTVQPYPVPHDAREPVQYVFAESDCRLGVLTDTGMITPHIQEMLLGINALLLEFNHDQAMLASGPYPPSLQRRVGGRLGHLNNEQATALLADIDHDRLRHLVVAHVSEKNNHPDKVRESILSRLPQLASRLTLTNQSDVSPWFEV
ncbi:MBL fold metallo-hydrolase [Sedimenticola selenatireducens]|uniref:MBL fold metallo-hydrolase n=1 Tax=Sedimenticola selenatireducens TaxID=191960 RepID=A0A557SBP4_9GAMM|nr:MBL fold metallo-hydrolase [Sedimenticola selenatireducens]TVO74837.1 MBL fold metallo-hydrolase [Sedimenticola selenatireducens]TVT62372.1 MAG: MBL fold metallo-hydrolase [Sedimenticola selenatireducens]